MERLGQRDGRGVRSVALQSDAFAGYDAVYNDGRVRETRCMAHARHKFHDLYIARRNEVNAEALRRNGELYGIEATIRGKPPDERRRVRQKLARPLVDAFEARLRLTLGKVSQKSETTKAISYALNQWSALTLYFDDRAVERALER
jgi:transposase